jgi:A/G-specific adenine glycosylase
MKTENIASLLLEWFNENGREYPWRKKTSPYRILMAEIMLQRTKADQVLPVYKSFLKKFPDLDTLAKASSKEIEMVFAQLGLRWRAERVRKLVSVLISDYNRQIPDIREKLLSLPSIGEYVADAILCFAYERDIAVVDSNVCRVIGRVFGLKARGEARRDPKFRQVAQQLVPKGKAKEFNWAIIDLGAMICTPRNPFHASCPIKSYCTYYRHNKEK